MHHQRWGVKWWMLEYEMTYFNSNFVFLLANHNSDDNRCYVYSRILCKILASQVKEKPSYKSSNSTVRNVFVSNHVMS